ncbi:MAG: hypothetical protein K1W02_09330 [Muribaculaceae bacterium]|jgi:hypothetical protein
MKKVILSSLVILLTGCISENDDMQPRYSSSIQTIEEALNTYINVTKNKGTRSEEKAYTLNPYVIEDDTVMYVSQYLATMPNAMPAYGVLI